MNEINEIDGLANAETEYRIWRTRNDCTAIALTNLNGLKGLNLKPHPNLNRDFVALLPANSGSQAN